MKLDELKCEDAAEFVSALCDGERIPASAAEHIGECALCGARMNSYAQMGAELRRVASMQLLDETKDGNWKKTSRTAPGWWQKGWQTMRIPRFAFALMLVAIIALGSSLTMIKVRAHGEGKVLLLAAKTASGRTIRCAFDMEGKASEPFNSVQMVNGVPELYGFRFLSRDGDRIELGVRAGAGANLEPSTDEVDKLPETAYWFQPGEKLKVNVEGSGTIVITGELQDHMPPAIAQMGDQLDPNAGELRLIAPLLLRGKTVVQDFGGFTVSGTGKDQGIQLCVPGDGRYELSLSQLAGASEGQVNESRISFELNGQAYQLLAGAPVARAERIWVLHLPNGGGQCFNGYVPMRQYVAKTQRTN
jgi:hypothetical protein